jgi:hypothetical protein
MTLDLLDTVGTVSTEIALHSAKAGFLASVKGTTSYLEHTAREEARKVLQVVGDKLNSVKQASQQIAQRVPFSLLTTESELASTLAQTVDNLNSANQVAIDEANERSAWASLEEIFWGSVTKKAGIMAIATKTTSALSPLVEDGRVCNLCERLGSKLPALPTLNMPSLSIPKLTMPSISLPNLPMPSLSMPTFPSCLNFCSNLYDLTTKFSWPTLPSFLALPSLPDIVTGEYAQKGIEKGIEIVIDKGVNKVVDESDNLVREAIDRPLDENVEKIKEQIEPGLRHLIGEKTTECIRAATTIVRYRTASCATYINGGIQSLKGKITGGLQAASHSLFNSCRSPTLPLTV